MAYYLAFTSGSEYVDIPSAISVSGDGVLAEIDFEYKGASNDVICGGTSFSDYWRINNDNQFRISIAGSANNVNLISPLVVGTRYMLKLVRTGSSVEVRDSTNTAITSATNISANPFIIGKIGSFHNGSSNLTMDLYGFKAGSETYNPSLSNGTGSILPTESGSNQGVLTNFPTDDSQWVFYDDGGGSTVTVDVAFSVSAPSVSGGASATLPQPNVDIAYTVSVPSVNASVSASLPNPNADVSYTVNIPTVSASASSTLPQPQSDLSFTVSTPSVDAGASVTIPGYNASVSFSVNAPSLSSNASATLPTPVANISYTVSTPNINANTTASLPQPLSDIVFTVNTPSVSATASATQTGWNADVDFTVNAPSVSISASATLPQPDSSVSFAVSPPQVSVVAIVGGIAIIVDDETNINQRVLSTNINAPILSNNING